MLLSKLVRPRILGPQLISRQQVLENELPSFFELEHRHTTSIIASYITRALNEYGILNSIFSISLDNALANNNAVDILKRNLMPIFSGVFFHPHIEKIRNCILYVRNGSHRRHEFQTFCSERGRKCKKYLIDVDHRWNSTYEMLECAYDDRDIISMFCNDKFSEDQVTNYDWEVKFKKYFGKLEPLPILSMILDPRFKIDGTFCMIDSYDKNMGLDHSFLKENYRSLFYDMYNEYHEKYGDRRAFNLSTTIESSSSGTKNRSATYVVNLINQQFFMGGSSSSSNSSTTPTSSYEINHYLNNNITNFLTSEEIDNFDILSWWKKQEHSYSVLAAMARDLLTPPISTVASESCFSAGKRVLDDRRSRMNQQTVQMCICLKDWLDAEDRLQD
ncbi:Ribonuclease H-like protein [Dioscorea alata]|uniref:Ribonuclease H-like protein n=1 Tax=Dioscorea alata TaxID=55571 RepID=A0ACB7VA04_DIOAL|nr:Ribonuclease H-like protein [Dioscorea alata]